MRIDSHQHFWQYNPRHQVWMTDEMEVLKRDYLPPELAPLLGEIGFDGTVAVQARQMLEETEWLLELSDEFTIIKGVVGWVDLRANEIGDQLEKYSQHPRLCGVRHVVHDEPNDQFMLLPEFRRGISQLESFNLAYDLLLFPIHVPVALQLVDEFEEQPFVIDHIAKPDIKNRQFSPWREDMEEIARRGHVCCKLSGMVTETNWSQWQKEDFADYMEIMLEAFGPERLMIGSDWPVCTLSGAYTEVMGIVIDYVQRLSPGEQEAILGGTCCQFYGLRE